MKKLVEKLKSDRLAFLLFKLILTNANLLIWITMVCLNIWIFSLLEYDEYGPIKGFNAFIFGLNIFWILVVDIFVSLYCLIENSSIFSTRWPIDTKQIKCEYF